MPANQANGRAFHAKVFFRNQSIVAAPTQENASNPWARRGFKLHLREVELLRIPDDSPWRAASGETNAIDATGKTVTAIFGFESRRS
jgi:hypothetical protein